MKRFLKVMLGVGTICVVSGMVLSGVSLAFSGSAGSQSWRSMWKQIRYHQLDDLDDVWEQKWEQKWEQWENEMDDLEDQLGDLDDANYVRQNTQQTVPETALAAVSEGHHYNSKNKNGYQELVLGDSFEDAYELELELGSWDVTIQEDETAEQIKVAAYDRSSSDQIVPLKVKQTGNTVKIYDVSREGVREDEWQKMLKDTPKGILEIVVPKGMVLQGLDIELGRGIFHGKNLKVAELDVESVGTLSFETCEVGKLDVSIVGNMDFIGAVTREADIQCVSSEVSLLLDGKMEDFNYEIEGVKGSVTIGGQTRSEAVYEIKEYYSAGKTIEMECVTSEVQLSFQ